MAPYTQVLYRVTDYIILEWNTRRHSSVGCRHGESVPAEFENTGFCCEAVSSDLFGMRSDYSAECANASKTVRPHERSRGRTVL